MSDIHSGHRKRMLEKFEKYGFSVFSDHEKLEIILYFSIPRHDTNETAHLMLKKYCSISAVMDASADELKQFPYITDRTVQLFKIIKETSALYSSEKTKQKTYLKTTDEMAIYFQSFFAAVTDEHFAVMSLDNNGKFLGCEFTAQGDISSVGVSNRKIVETVLKTKATTVVICHNHPGGIALPSQVDICITSEISKILSGIGVYLKDHIIIADGNYISLAENSDYKKIFS